MRDPKDIKKQIQLEFSGSELGVRKALQTIIDGLVGGGHCQNDLGLVEVVLAEVFNNIVEHAYEAGSAGRIFVSVTVCAERFCFLVTDEGRALPFEAISQGGLPELDGPLETLPEGGFGWYLVRKLASDLSYQRKDGRNELMFSMPFQADL
ncbi:ATP-binding protein [Lentibacter sp.]|uniref:ATP-binding protein n=1 Tax=Lentibacter sp. TaxID=2024994 RepID=UPI003F69B72D